MSNETASDTQSGLDSVVLLSKQLDLAQSQNIPGLIGIPETQSGFEKLTLNEEMTTVLRDRLYRLGYLVSKKIQPSNPNDLHQAVCNMQLDAGLHVDGWVGLQTWQALQELFSFEGDSNLQKWNVAPFKPFMEKAIRLRLKTFGFDVTVKSSGLKVRYALQRWHEFLALIDIVSDEKTLTDVDLVHWLFDVDSLTKKVQQSRKKLLAATQSEALIQQCISALLKIELWLHGVEKIKPNGKRLSLERQKKTINGKVSVYSYSDDYKVLKEFWREVGLTSKHHSNQLVLLLRSFKYLSVEGVDDSFVNDREDTIAREFDTQFNDHPQEIIKQWEKKRASGRFFDGIKRAYRAFKNMVKSAVNYFIKKLKGVVRIAKYLTNESVGFVKKTFQLLHDGAAILVRKPMFNVENKLCIHRDVDFDLTVFVSDLSTHAEIKKICDYIHNSACRFKAALKLVGLIIDVTKLVSVAAGAWTWLWLIKVLLAFRKKLSIEELKIIKDGYLTYS